MCLTASRTLGDYDINILNLDAQEETSRILIIVEDIDNNVANAIKAVHLQRISNDRKNNSLELFDMKRMKCYE